MALEAEQTEIIITYTFESCREPLSSGMLVQRDIFWGGLRQALIDDVREGRKLQPEFLQGMVIYGKLPWTPNGQESEIATTSALKLFVKLASPRRLTLRVPLASSTMPVGSSPPTKRVRRQEEEVGEGIEPGNHESTQM